MMRMTWVWRGLGGLMLGYAAVYLAQYLFSALYEKSSRVWAVLNVVSAVAILVALAVNLWRLRAQAGGDVAPLARLGRTVLAYANAALVIWFFHNWIRLLILAPGESPRPHHEVIWQVIAVLIPLVLATTGWRLWRESTRVEP